MKKKKSKKKVIKTEKKKPVVQSPLDIHNISNYVEDYAIISKFSHLPFSKREWIETRRYEHQFNANKYEHMFEAYYEDVPQPNGGVIAAKRYIMNRDGFSLLIMGYTGKKAMKFKLDYIAAFNAMEKALKEQAKPKSREELLVESAQLLLEQSKRIEKVESRLNAIEKEREENTKLLLAAKVSDKELPTMKLRDNIRQLVNRYANARNLSQSDVWHKWYENNKERQLIRLPY